jgi:hypothetical protein
MYKPNGVDSIWVTLRELHWSWHGTATKNLNTGKWTIQNPGYDLDPPSVDTIQLPEWDSNIAYDLTTEKDV